MTGTAGLIGPESTRWREVLGRVAHQIYHLPEYAVFDAELSGGRPVAFLYEEDGGSWLLPLVLRSVPGTDRLDAASPYGHPGPVSDRADEQFWTRAVTALVRTLAASGAVSLFVRMDPLAWLPHGAFEQVGTLVPHGSTVSIDLRLSKEEWWPEVRRDHRSAINRAVRLGRTSVMDDWSHLDEFVAMYHQTMTRVGATEDYFFDRAYLERIRGALDGRVHLMMSLAADEPIAGSVFLETGGVVQAHIVATKPSYRREEPTRFLVSECVEWGRQRGCTDLHLGGGVGGREDSIFHFKKGFSRRRHEFFTFRAVLDPTAYAELTSAGQEPSPDVTGYFPAYRRPGEQPARPA
jgi:GNAT superfamily N-acetyltransferase